MSKIELIDAYVRGDIDRRSFMRKLAALGVSATAAAAYAGSLAQGASAAPSTSFAARAQDDDGDDDYGVGDVIAGIIASIISLIRSILESIFGGFFASGDFEQAGLSDGQVAMLRQMSSQMEEQASALDRYFGTMSTPKANAEFANVNDALASLAAEYNRYTAALARAASSTDSAEVRDLVMSAGFSASRQAAIANELAGGAPFAGAFERKLTV